MLSVINSEFYKLCKRRGNRIIVLITCFCGCLIGSISVSSAESVIEMGSKGLIPWFYLEGSNIYNIFFVLTIVMSMIFFALEYNENTLKSVLFRGTSRVSVFFSKYILNILMMFFLLFLFVFFGSVVVELRSAGEGALLPELIGSGFVFIGKELLIMISYSSIFVLIGIVSKNLIATIALSYGIRIIEAIVVLLCRGIGNLDWVEKMIIANYDFYLIPSITKEMISHMSFCVVVSVVFMFAALIVFCKQDVKK